MKTLFTNLTLAIVFITCVAPGQIPLLEENFLYAPGRLVNTLPYNVRASSGTYKQTVSWTTLSYTGYAGSGIGLSDSLTSDGDDYSIDWANYVSTGIVLPATGVNSGSVYLAALVNVQSVTSTSDYFLSMHYNNTFTARVYVDTAGSNFNFGVSKGGTPITYETTARTLGQTYLIVVKYTFNTGSTTDDRIDFWVNPTVGGTEPTATIANFTDVARNDITMWTGVCLRQGATTAPRVLVGGIRMGTDWATTVAPQYVWTGTTDNNFQTPTNWSPNRTSPTVYDVLVFNSGVSVLPTSPSTQSISGLVIDRNTTLTLSATGLTVTGSLTLASGTLSGAGNLTLGNSATIVRANGTVNASPAFGSATNLFYCGTSAQTTGLECPPTVNSLTIANASGTTLSNNLAVNSILKVGGIMALNGKTVTLGTSTPAMGSVTFTNGYGGFAGSGTFKRWFPASAIAATSGNGNNGQFPMTTSASNNRTVVISGTPTAGGSVSISYNDASTKSPISFTENSLNFVNRFDANWVVTAGDGLTCSAITLAINGAGIPGVNAIVDLNISGAAGAAPGTFSATTGAMAAPVVNRTGLTQATLPLTYYFASTSNSTLPVEQTLEQPRVLALFQNFPNPFNPSTKINFTVANDAYALLSVYNSLGQEVASLFNGIARVGHVNSVVFDAKALPSGVYYSVLNADGRHLVKKLMLLK
jgi:hypothetical protein